MPEYAALLKQDRLDLGVAVHPVDAQIVAAHQRRHVPPGQIGRRAGPLALQRNRFRYRIRPGLAPVLPLIEGHVLTVQAAGADDAAGLDGNEGVGREYLPVPGRVAQRLVVPDDVSSGLLGVAIGDHAFEALAPPHSRGWRRALDEPGLFGVDVERTAPMVDADHRGNLAGADPLGPQLGIDHAARSVRGSGRETLRSM